MKPFKHQLLSLKHNDTTPIVFDTSDPGTGKTAVRVWAYKARHDLYKHKVLVLCPNTIKENVWESAFKKLTPHLKVLVATSKVRKKTGPKNYDVYITNHDATTWLSRQPSSFWEGFDEVIIDESTAYKHHTSLRSKSAYRIMKHFTYKACLTGTPNSRSITDVWHQVKLLDNGKRLGTQFFAFRNSVCVPQQLSPFNQNAVKWVDMEGAEQTVFDLLSDITIRHRREDCVDIPEMQEYTREYVLSAKQKKAYDKMEEEQYVEMQKGNSVTAINAASVATKLQQIASGAVYDDNGGYQLVDTERYKLVMDLAKERKHPLVFFLWKHQCNELVNEAEKRGMTFAVLDGSASSEERNELMEQYQKGAYDVVFAHPQTAGHGLTFTKGTSIIWCSPTYNLEWYAQGSIRQQRIGQTEKTENIIIIAKGTIDEKVNDIMQNKSKRMTNLLDLFAVSTDDRKDMYAKDTEKSAGASSVARETVTGEDRIPLKEDASVRESDLLFS